MQHLRSCHGLRCLIGVALLSLFALDWRSSWLRRAHLAGAVKLEFVNGREGKIAKGVLTAKAQVFLRAEGGTGAGQAELAALFQTTKQNISLHIRNVLAEGELVAAATVKDHLTVWALAWAWA